MKHRGEIVQTEIDKSGFSKTLLAERLGIARRTLYNRLDEPNLSWEFILQIGQVIKHDFRTNFPQLSKIPYIVEEPLDDYSPNKSEITLPSCMQKLQDMTDKYINLLERYNALLGNQT